MIQENGFFDSLPGIKAGHPAHAERSIKLMPECGSEAAKRMGISYLNLNILAVQLFSLLLLAIPIACVAWTVTHEEVFREPREWCARNSKDCNRLVLRKFFYLFTCEYCFSHYVTIIFLFITHFHLLYPDWRGYLVSGFALVWVANIYMSAFGRVRLDIKHERVVIAEEEQKLEPPQ